MFRLLFISGLLFKGLTSFAQPTVTLNLITDPTCWNTFDGAIDVIVTGGQPPYTFDWDIDGTGDFDDPEDLSGIPKGTYNLVVKDDNGDTDVLQVDIVNPPDMVMDTIAFQNETCTGTNDGFMEIIGYNGTSPYIYYWYDGPTLIYTAVNNGLIEGLEEGDYILVIEDGNGCIVTDTFTVSTTTVSATLPSISLDGTTDVSCNGGSTGTASITVVDGTAPYTFDWNYDGTNDFDDPEDPNNLSAGNHQVIVHDANNCPDTLDLIISEPPPFSYQFVSNQPSCCGANNGSFEVDYQGGTPPYTYSIDNFNTTQSLPEFTGLFAGLYEMIIMDANGCMDTLLMAVSDVPNIQLNFTTDSSCTGGSSGNIYTQVMWGCGPFSFDWDYDGTGDNDDPQNPTGLAAGTYNVMVEGTGLCFAYGQVTIYENTGDMSAQIDSVQHNLCLGDEIGSIHPSVSSGNPPYAYDWDIDGLGDMDDTPNQYNLPPGAYTLVVVDNLGCTDTIVQIINDGVAFNATLTSYGDSLVADQTGTYQWVECPQMVGITGYTDQYFQPLVDGDYAVIIESTDGCIDTSDCVTVEGIGFDEITHFNVSISPNPASEQVVLQFTDVFIGKVGILDLNGKLIRSSQIADQTIVFDLNGLPTGIYFVEIISDDINLTKKLIVR